MTTMPSGWSSMSEEDRGAFLFAAPEWQIDSLLADEPEAEAGRLRVLIEQKWTGLSDSERVDLLIEGPQWMREGIRTRLAPEDAERLEGEANTRWASMPEEEKIELLAGVRLAGAREDILTARERDPAQTVRLLEIANERANERVRAGIEAWELEHPGRAYSTAADYRTDPSARIISDFWQGYDDDAPLSCFACDWAGRTADGSKDLHDELFQVACPQCGQMLLVVSYSTLEQTQLAADGGNAAAQAELERLEPYPPEADATTTEAGHPMTPVDRMPDELTEGQMSPSQRLPDCCPPDTQDTSVDETEYAYGLRDGVTPYRTAPGTYDFHVFSDDDDGWMRSNDLDPDSLWESTPEEIAGMIGGTKRLAEPIKGTIPWMRPDPEAPGFAGERPLSERTRQRPRLRDLLRSLARHLKS